MRGNFRGLARGTSLLRGTRDILRGVVATRINIRARAHEREIRSSAPFSQRAFGKGGLYRARDGEGGGLIITLCAFLKVSKHKLPGPNGATNRNEISVSARI